MEQHYLGCYYLDGEFRAYKVSSREQGEWAARVLIRYGAMLSAGIHHFEVFTATDVEVIGEQF